MNGRAANAALDAALLSPRGVVLATLACVLTGAAVAWMDPLHLYGAMLALALLVPVVWIVGTPARAIPVYAFALTLDVYLSVTLRVTSTQLLQAAVLAAWVVPKAFSLRPAPHARRGTGIPYRWGLALVIFLVASLSWSADPETSARHALRLVVALAMGAYVGSHIESADALRRTCRALVAAGVVTALYGLAQYVRGDYDALYPFFSPFYTDLWVHRGGGFAIVSTFANPNILAGYLLFVIPLAWAAHAEARGAARWGWLAASGVLCVAMLLTFSKASWIILALLAVAWLMSRLPAGATLAMTSLAGVGIALILFTLGPFIETLVFLFPNSREASVDVRIGLWWAALMAFLERPWLGFGLDGFAGATAPLRPGVLADLVRAHNIYLQSLVDLGVVGMLLIWAPVVTVMRRGLRLWSRSVRGAEDPYHVALLLSAASFLLVGLVDVHFSNQYVNTTWFVFGLLAASSRVLGPGTRKAGE